MTARPTDDAPENRPNQATTVSRSALPTETHAASAGVAEIGSQIGPYRLIRKVGEGGMGQVWQVRQDAPIRRTAALKLIKLGMDTKDVLARFESERQALAMMDHPNIAHVFDAGATDEGRPYFAMEFVEGVPIHRFCDDEKLTMRERLQLFLPVCEGVQHAHQKGIIHRDIKPTNVLVSFQDGRSLPKVIDFGVAKATEHRLTEKTVYTQMGVLIGTPEYMSPEQASMTEVGVDTRTDVYSLAVMLYELLVGALPFDPKGFRKGGFDEIRRRIREDEPRKPSTRVSALGEESVAVARRRRTDVRTMRKQLRGDLDWITMRGLEKERARRYPSPSELAADIRRHLKHEPVVASPPSKLYRAKKFVRRHRMGVAMTMAVFLLVAGFGVRESIQANQIARERDRASQEAETAQQISDFLLGLFQVSDPSESRGNSVTAREMLDRGAERIRAELVEQPLVQARLMSTMGVVYYQLGLYQESEPLLEESLATRRELLGPRHLDTVESLSRLANLYFVQSRYDETEPLYMELLEARRELLGEDHYDTMGSTYNLGNLYKNQWRLEEAEPYLKQALESMRRVLGDEDPGTLYPMGSLSNLYALQGRAEEAIETCREILDIRRRVLGVDHPLTLGSMNNLGNTYRMVGRYEEAEEILKETREAQTRILGAEHPDTMTAETNLAVLYWAQKRYAEAEQAYLEVLALERKVLGESHLRTLYNMSSLASVYADQGRYAEAEALERELDARAPTPRELLAIWRHAADRPGDHRAKNSYAWRLLTGQPEDLRDPEEALRWALKANDEIGRQEPRYLHTLSLAYYRTGDAPKAIETERLAISQLPDGASALRIEMETQLEQFEEEHRSERAAGSA
jgi:non-specific serine/threonine protein kinase/serine/threonine-protein kinase